MKSPGIDIKALTSELRSHTVGRDRKRSGEQETVKEVPEKRDPQSPEAEVIIIKKPPPAGISSEKTVTFMEFIDRVNAVEYGKLNRFVYISDDIHEVFLKLKSHTRLRISHLATYLLEQFIRENQEAIQSILVKKPNKFIDR